MTDFFNLPPGILEHGCLQGLRELGMVHINSKITKGNISTLNNLRKLVFQNRIWSEVRVDKLDVIFCQMTRCPNDAIYV